MSPSCYVRTRVGKTGTRFHVRYRLGGREAPERHDSTWDTKRLALDRKRLIEEAWARGMPVPPVTPPEPAARLNMLAVLDDYIAARVDVGPARAKTYRQTRKLLGHLETIEPEAVTPRDLREWIAGLVAANKARKTIEIHLGVVRAVLDHAELPVNPARHPSVKLPRGNRDDEQIAAPTTAEWAALLDQVTARHRAALVILEETGLRIGELRRATWGDVDLRLDRIRVRGTKTAAAARWIPLTPRIRALLEASCPLEDRRHDRPLVTVVEQTLRGAMDRACRDAGITHYSPHDLRHRYISLLVHAGTPIPIVKLVVGHTRGSVTLDTYAHVLVDEDPKRLAHLRAEATRVVAGEDPATLAELEADEVESR